MRAWGARGQERGRRAAGGGRGPRAAHLVFLLLELLLQVELLRLQVVDALPQLLGLLPARAAAGARGTAGNADGPACGRPDPHPASRGPALPAACPPAEGPPTPARPPGLPGLGPGDTEDRAEACSPVEHLGQPRPHLRAGGAGPPEPRRCPTAPGRAGRHRPLAAAAPTHAPTPSRATSPTSAGPRSGGRWPAPSASRPESSSSFPARSASCRFSAPSGVDSEQGSRLGPGTPASDPQLLGSRRTLVPGAKPRGRLGPPPRPPETAGRGRGRGHQTHRLPPLPQRPPGETEARARGRLGPSSSASAASPSRHLPPALPGRSQSRRFAPTCAC